MSKSTFRFDPDLWLTNRSLRACSPAARGFWVDLLCLCHPSGFLVLPNKKPMSDDQIATLVGASVKLVRGWLKELGESGIFSVSEDGVLFSSKMVKDAAFVAQAKLAGARGQERKKARSSSLASPNRIEGSPANLLDTGKARISTAAASAEGNVSLNQVIDEVALKNSLARSTPAKPKKALDWWTYPAGWIRQGAQQAMSMGGNEAFEDFQIRLAARIPPGRHLDALTAGQRAAVVAMTPKDPNEKKDPAS